MAKALGAANVALRQQIRQQLQQLQGPQSRPSPIEEVQATNVTGTQTMLAAQQQVWQQMLQQQSSQLQTVAQFQAEAIQHMQQQLQVLGTASDAMNNWLHLQDLQLHLLPQGEPAEKDEDEEKEPAEEPPIEARVEDPA